jgi:plasmid stabilization system protein ParE
MSGSEVIFHRLAAREYRSAREWYAERSTGVAERFCLGVDRAVNRIVADADAMPRLVGPYRYARVSGFPYVLVFRGIDAGRIMVVAVAHTSRRPGCWRRRK